MAPTRPAPPTNGFQRALKDFESRLKPSEKTQFKATTLDDLKVTILAIQSNQRSRKQMMHMGRIMSFLEAMEQFGKVIEVFLNVTNMLAFIWGPVKLLLVVCLRPLQTRQIGLILSADCDLLVRVIRRSLGCLSAYSREFPNLRRVPIYLCG